MDTTSGNAMYLPVEFRKSVTSILVKIAKINQCKHTHWHAFCMFVL